MNKAKIGRSKKGKRYSILFTDGNFKSSLSKKSSKDRNLNTINPLKLIGIYRILPQQISNGGVIQSVFSNTADKKNKE